jgi:hypothetical protein
MESHLDYNIGQIPFQDDKWSCGVGYVCIPSDIDRDIFITDCFLRGTLMIRTNDGGVYRNCPTNISTFNDITFPDVFTSNGTPVVYLTEPVHKQPMVIAALIFNDDIIDQAEDQFKIKKIYKDNIVEISGSAKDEFLTILVNGSKKSDFNIRLVNANNKANLNLEIDGDINILASHDITAQANNQMVQKVGVEDEVSSLTQTPTEINARINKFSINDGNEPITLGNALKTILDNLFTMLGESTTTTAIGQMPLLNGQQIAALKDETAKILSQISFTD